MPATEQTWRDTNLLHIVFGVSGLAMLVTTVWMLAADHGREWKGYQRTFRGIEEWTTVSRIDNERTEEWVDRDRELSRELFEAQSEVPDRELLDEFIEEAEKRATTNKYRLQAVEAGYEQFAVAAADWVAAHKELSEAKREVQAPSDGESAKHPQLRAALEQAEGAREDLLDQRKGWIDSMEAVIKKAKFDEDNRQLKLKSQRALLDQERSRYDMGIRDAWSSDRLVAQQAQVDAVKEGVDRLLGEYQQAKAHRVALQGTLDQITAREAAARKVLEEHETALDRLHRTREEQGYNIWKGLLASPIIDAFGRPLKVEQIWLPKLTLNNNFRDVARFDRCTTCHLGIDKTAPGSAIDPAYVPVQLLSLALPTPEQDPARVATADEAGSQPQPELTRAERLEKAYGIQLAEQGLVDTSDVTVSAVRQKSLGARALLRPGDVLRYIKDVKVLDKQTAYRYLLESVEWGRPIEIKVARGVPQPYSSHPRLDLFVGSLSPHPMGEFGCTICHDGQGSATEFKWASHTPNTPGEGFNWKRDHEWFNNHHWILPMYPERFAQSSCLKCHHDVAELETSERFPDPPAPKLMAGWNLIQKNGCFGCHEINGFDGPDKRRGPDLRAEAPYFAAAAQLLIDPGLTDRERDLAQTVIDHPEDEAARKLLAESIRRDAQAGADDDSDEPARLTSQSHELASILGADDATPAQLRKVGPSLRYVKSKLDLTFLYNWIREPKDFRPSTRMPQFFGLHDHLKAAAEHGSEEDSAGLEQSLRFEPVEIRAVSEYLLTYSQPFEYADRFEGITEEPSAERGKELFQVRGCLTCHQHKDFPEIKATQGPDLSRMGAKLDTASGERWLYSWVREPNRYHARTVMPNLFLDPISQADGSVTDPAADITAYLLGSQGWKPKAVPELDKENLDELARIYLAGSFSAKQSEEFVKQGIPQELRDELKGDERELLREEAMTPKQFLEKKLLYVGRRSIGRLGCTGCHDIPGFENAKPIGTGLADWGRKETSKLAFEQIVHYLQPGGAHGQGGRGADRHDAHHLSPEDMPADTGFFVEKLLSHEREGFLWQKLREPRSYDYKKVENKDYLDRLRMPKFNFTAEEIEQVMTFVLGLVAEPPAAEYVYKPTPRRKAIVEGEKVLAKFNCGGCHPLGMETWEFEYDPDEFEDPFEFNDYAFLMPHFTPEELAASTKTDRRGMGHAVVTGRPNPAVQEDDDGNPLYYFELWQPAAINGQPWVVGGPEVPVPEASIVKKRPQRGGDFANYLHPIAMELGARDNPNVKASDVWGWVPPPLVREGQKVQSAWLHNFLLNPYRIRPAALLRMPKFNMSPEEAAALVNYFAAVDDAPYPYVKASDSRVAARSASEVEPLEQALTLVTDNTYCVKCHLVGDFVPKGADVPPAADLDRVFSVIDLVGESRASDAALAPNLDRVYTRLRPDYVHEWLANPKRKLPYTGMPVNFPPGTDPNETIRRQLFPGSSEEALEAVVDLLLNYDIFTKQKFPIKPLVKEPAPSPEDAADEDAAAGGNAAGG